MTEPRRIDTQGLKALAHPLRVKILDLVSDLGEATATVLAERLGESSGATSYHLRQLGQHGFIEEVPDRGTARERWWRVPKSGWETPARVVGDLPAAAAGIITHSMVEGHAERLQQMLDAVGDLPAPWSGAVGWRRGYTELTADEMHRMRDEVYAVLDRYRNREPHPGSHRVSIEFIGFPIGVPVADDE
ncbi:helix-turn-helix protein [Antricoccus suffuscus]|uniref:Helix-turn-helix protein n=1 Tax=Antricoccus suffuscus TaxID=1629062 RepID=A0A2T1A546_9ACTN|nr:helix-turn-helix domain-containing protein [Antricoccus suffuscus]PRZ43607.1 helix-turn-helix protein [Antricoccus suffuscus]